MTSSHGNCRPRRRLAMGILVLGLMALGLPAARAQAPEATVPPPSTPETNDLDRQAAAEIAALQNESTFLGGTVEEGESRRLNLYGFADFSFSRNLGLVTREAATTFAVGNLNLYMASELGDEWRSLVEVRFMYLPNGGQTGATNLGPRTDTTVNDYSDFGRPVQWGGIHIERAWLERTFHKLLTVRVGHWLTPYGIWNVDHGTPVVIGTTRPYIVGEALFPASQTGIELYGTADFRNLQLGYHLTLSNGRGPIATYQDLDDNKALGGRWYLRYDSPVFGMLTVGGAFYRGRYTNSYPEMGIDAKGVPTTLANLASQYDELSLSADIKWQWGRLLVQGEAIENQVAYTAAGRPIAESSVEGAPPIFESDYRRWGAYGLVGYRFPFWGTMPYGGAGYYKYGSFSWIPAVADFWVGINLRPTPRVVLKLQYTQAHFLVDAVDDLKLLTAQTAWSF